MNDPRTNDERFDLAMRDRYRQAAQQLSPSALAQLRQARRATVAPGRALRHRYSWPLLGGAGALAATIFAVAFGLGLRDDALPNNETATAVMAAANAYGEPATPLEQDPDFYAWLGSADAELVAME